MAVIRFFLFGILALLVSGCMQTVSESIYVPAEQPAVVACPKTVVVLPFAEYFTSSGSAYRKNKLVSETVIDCLVAKGFKVPVQEDVLRYLVDNKIVSRVSAEKDGTANMANIEKELSWGWSEEMSNRLRDLIADSRGQDSMLVDADDSSLEMPGMYGLDEKSVKAIGSDFGADYLVRGRIIEYSGSSGQKPQAKVMLRMWVQDVSNGEVVWTNRADAEASSNTVFTKRTTGDLLDSAVSKAVTKLVDDFSAKNSI